MFSIIKNRIYLRIKDDKGVVAIIVGIALVAIVGILAYVIDTGSLYEARRSLQTAADAAALAGVQELPENPNGAIQVATDYAQMQGATISSSDVNIESTFVSNDTIKVTVSETGKKTFFAGIFGINSANVGATATAMIGSPSKVTGVVPWGFTEKNYTPGVEYTLKYGSPPDLASGSFGALAIDSTGTPEYLNGIVKGCTTPLSVGMSVGTKTGDMGTNNKKYTSERVYNQPNSQFDNFSQLTEHTGSVYEVTRPGDSQFIIVPWVSEFTGGSHPVQILGFLQFVITSINGSIIKGTFVNKAILQSDQVINGVDSSGLRIIRLLE